MPQAVDIQHAEQGKTVRINFVVLSAGIPFTPTLLSVDVIDPTGPTTVASLSAVTSGEIGEYYVDWDISLSQAAQYYELAIDADTGAFTDSVNFKVNAAGTFEPSTVNLAGDVQTALDSLSKAKNEDIFVAMVRTILRDHPQLNRLTKGRETSDGEIKIAMNLAVSQYNGVPPLLTAVSFATFPSIAYLTIGTLAWVIQSSMLLRMRNNLQYSDGGVTVDTENLNAYVQAGTGIYGPAYNQWIQQFKIAKNLADAFGSSPTGVHSEYFLLSSLMGDSSFGGAGTMLQ